MPVLLVRVGVRRGRGPRRLRHRVVRRPVADAADRPPTRRGRARPRERHPRRPPARAGSAGSSTSARRSCSARSPSARSSLLEAVLGPGLVFWPLVIAIVGVALLWRQADEAQRERWVDASGRIDPVRIVLGDGGWASYARLAAGVGLIVVALVLFALRRRLALGRPRRHRGRRCSASPASRIVVGPWLYRLAADLSDERDERVRTQERADVAAHLHDSVLQTLALIQKNAADGVARLARAQERDLRSWLYAERVHRREHRRQRAARRSPPRSRTPTGSPSTSSPSATAPSTRRCEPIVVAAREAMINAAKHAGRRRGRRLRRGHAASGRRVRPRPRHAASTRHGRRRTGSASGTASSTGWTATAAPRRSGRRRARAPRSGCTSTRGRRTRHG